MSSVVLQNATAAILSLLDSRKEELLEAENAGHFSPEFIADIAGTGFFSLTRPRQYGGEEIEYEELLLLIMQIAMRNGSLAWCLMIMAQHNISVRSYDRKVTDALFQSGPLMLATSFTPLGFAESTANGYELSGTWKYATGIHFANWMMVDAEIKEEGDRIVGKFVVPANHFQIQDDWDVLGMKATGSCSVVLSRHNVAAWQCVARVGVNASEDNRRQKIPRRYRIPQRVMTALGTLVPMVGMLSGMLNDAMPPPTRKKKPGSSLEEIAMRSQLLNLKDRIEQTEILFRSLAKEVTALTMKMDGGFDLHDQYSVLSKCATLTNYCRELSSELFAMSGTKASRQGSPIGERMVDIHVMSTHYLVRSAVTGINAALASLNG